MTAPISQAVAIVTGASRGIGRALALGFADKGYAVGINFNKSKDAAEKTVSDIEKKGAQALLLPGDVSDPKAVEAMAKMVSAKWGRVDVFVNNAGMSKDSLIVKADPDDWDRTLAINLKGPFNCIKTFAPLMKNSGGAFLNVCSHLARKSVPGTAAYSASKAGLISLTETAAMELGRWNVRVNALIPGFHVTDLSRGPWQKKEKEIREWHLLKDMPDTGELAKFAVGLCELKTVTGQTFAFESRIL